MEEKRFTELGSILDDSLSMSDEGKRLQKMRNLLSALVFMNKLEKKLVGDGFIKKLEPIFHALEKIKVGYMGHGNELDFDWKKFVAFVKRLLVKDPFVAQYASTYEEMIEELNRYKIPLFFFYNFLEVYKMEAVFFPCLNALYYIRKSDDGINTLRRLGIATIRKNFEDLRNLGKIVCFGPDRLLSFSYGYTSLWAIYDDIGVFAEINPWTGASDAYMPYRHVLGSCPDGSAVLLRDSKDKKRVEVVKALGHGYERYLMDYNPGLSYLDGSFFKDKVLARKLKKENRTIQSVVDLAEEREYRTGYVGYFGLTENTGRLNYSRNKLRDGRLWDGEVYGKTNNRSDLKGYIYYDCSLEMFVIMWPAGLSLIWLHKVITKFDLKKNWCLRFQEPRK